MTNVKVWTDGSAETKSINRYGGWAYYISYGDYETYGHGGCSNTTISRMELRAIIESMKRVVDKNCVLEITSDSQYTIKSINECWLFNWERENFIDRANSDLWKLFLVEYRKFKNKPIFKHVRGHKGILENEIADRLASYSQFEKYEKDL